MNRDYLRRTGRTEKMIEMAKGMEGRVTIIVHSEQMKKEIRERMPEARIVTIGEGDKLRGLDPGSKNVFVDNGVIDGMVRLAEMNWVRMVDILERMK